MRSERRKKLIILIMLLIGVCSISVGFAAYSTSLKIESGLAIAPDESAFSIQFSSSSSSLKTDPVSPSSKSEGLEATDAIITNSTKPTIGGYRATFTKTQQYVTYSFYVRNTGKYTAYLNSIGFSGEKNCIAKPGTTESSVSENCDDVSVRTTVKVGNIKTTETMLDITGETLTPNQSKLVEVTFEYFGGGKFIDGDFSIEFPEISLYYATTGGINGSFGDDSGLITLTNNSNTLALSNITSKQLANYRIYGSSEGVGNNPINLFNKKQIYTRYTDSIVKEEDKIIITSPSRGGTKWYWSYVPVQKGKTYTVFSKNTRETGVTNNGITYKLVTTKIKDYNSTELLDNRVISSKERTVITSDIDGYLLLVWGLPVEASSMTIEYIHVEEGDVATPTEPDKYIVPITVRGKNLFNVNGITNSTDVYVEDNIIYSHVYAKSISNRTYTLCPSLRDGDIVVLSGETSAQNNTEKMTLLYYYSLVAHSSKKWSFNQSLFATNDLLNSIFVFYTIRQTGVDDKPAYYKNMQIEKGTTATAYEPYVPATNINVEISRPLKSGEYIDFKEQKVVRRNGTKEDISIPAITTFTVPTTIIEVETTGIPSMIEVSYFK